LSILKGRMPSQHSTYTFQVAAAAVSTYTAHKNQTVWVLFTCCNCSL